MNMWQALKKIARDQFFHPTPGPKLAVGYYVVNTRAKMIVRKEPFLTEWEAREYIAFWGRRGDVIEFLDVYMGARRLSDPPVDESYWKL